MKIKKNLTLISLMFGVMLILMVSGVSAVTYGPVGPNYAQCTTDTGGLYTCTTQVKYDDLSYATMEGEEEIQGKWDWSTSGIPKNAIVSSVKVYVKGKEIDPNVDANIQLWSANTDQSLTNYQSFPYNTWTVLTFQDSRLTNEVQNRISAEQDVKLEVDFEKGTSTGCHDNCEYVLVDYVWLEITYSIPVCELTITKPAANDWFDSEAVPIEWELSEVCTPVNQFLVQYQTGGTCNPVGPWTTITTVDSQTAQNSVFPDYHYIWDRPSASGQYCVTVKVTSAGATGYSEIFNVDLNPPEVSLSVGDNKYGECLESETGDCYVNQQTPITLTCEDNVPVAPWQSGVAYIEYRYKVDGGDFGNWINYSTTNQPFNFPEDSNHELEYRCFDNVGKVDSESKTFIVESDTPELYRTVSGPKVCPENGVDECTEYFNLDTEICIYLTNLPEHTIPGITITCDYWWGSNNETQPLPNHNGSFQVADGGCFKYSEDSYHSLECKVTDSLQNSYTHPVWFDVVDAKAPVTTLTFEGPYHTETEKVCQWTKVKKWGWFGWYWKWVKKCETVSSGIQWIDGVSTVVLTAEDQTPHPVGVDETYYREGIVDEEFCWGTNESAFSGLSGEWIEYAEPFTMEESCHAIEYKSVDLLENEEVMKTEFVFVDKTAPDTLKDVGEPSASVNYAPQMNWYENLGQNIEWEVTLDTPVTISCGDVGPHQSGIKGMWYRIVWDGKYNELSAEWQFADDDKVVIYFNEKSEHLLEFYCVDNVNKTSEVDSELFKVKGTAFNLTIGAKWDLVSVPFQLIGDGNVEDVFGDDVLEVWSYEDGVWKVYSQNTQTLTNIVSGRGYWIRSAEDTVVLIGGVFYQDGGGVLPLDGINLEKGWNLIGHYGTTSKIAYCSLFGLGGTDPNSVWNPLLGYNPDQDVQSLFEVGLEDSTVPGRGYWIFMKEAETYLPSSMCYGFPTPYPVI